MTTNTLPKYLGPARAFRTRKRRELKAVLRALDEFSLGSAFVPRYAEYFRARNVIRSLQRSLSVKEWGR